MCACARRENCNFVGLKKGKTVYLNGSLAAKTLQDVYFPEVVAEEGHKISNCSKVQRAIESIKIVQVSSVLQG